MSLTQNNVSELKLHDWQEEAIEHFISSNFQDLFIVATGSGKTFVAIEIIKRLKELNLNNLRTLIVAPKNVILEKTWLNELNKFGFAISQIGLYNEFCHEISEITLVSIQSCKRLVKSGLYDLFDLVIFDEVHNYGTDNYLEILSIPKKYKLGLTATLERENKVEEWKIRECFSYNDFEYDIQSALSDKILNPFDFVLVKIQMDEKTRIQYEELTQSINLLLASIGGWNKYQSLPVDSPHKLKIMSVLNSRKDLIQNYDRKREVLSELISKLPNSKILVFNQFNKVSAEIYWELMYRNVKSEVLNSDIPKPKQTKILRDFEGNKCNVLLATTMLDEGYNLPKIDVAFIMASNSTSKQFVQRMGRVLRKKDRRSKVYYFIVADTFEEKYIEDKLDDIKSICNSFEVIEK